MAGAVAGNISSEHVEEKLFFVAERNLHTVVAMKLRFELEGGIGHIRKARVREAARNTKEALWCDVETLGKRLGRLLSEEEFEQRWSQIENHLRAELKTTNKTWKATFPGREILQWYCSELGIGINEFRSSLANKASSYPDFVRMLEETIKKVTEFDPLSKDAVK